MTKRILSLTGTLALLSGCATATPLTQRLVDVTGPVSVAQHSGDYALQAVRVPYEYDRLDHIDVYLQDVTAAGTLTKIGTLNYSGSSDADHTFQAVKFNNLLPRHSYSCVLRAFQADPSLTAPNNVVEVTASTIADSTTTFDTNSASATTGANDSVTVATGFKLKLADQTFNGLSTGNITATNGALNGTGNAPGLVITP